MGSSIGSPVYTSTSRTSPEASTQPPPQSVGSSSSVEESAPIHSPEPPKVLSLEEENERLRDEKLCKICWTGEVGVVFIPCGHLVCCINCSLAVSVIISRFFRFHLI